MATLIAVYNSDGCVGRCDAKCYQASSKGCHCICGGKNHGAGMAQSMANNAERVGLTKDDLERFAAERGFKCDELVAVDRTRIDNRRARREVRDKLRRPQLELDL